MLLTIPSFARHLGGWIEYHVYVDAEYQAAVRYRSLEKLYRDCLRSCKIVAKSTNVENAKELRRQSAQIPPFPPKKLFKLNDKQAQDRRLRLQNWLVALTQLPQSHPALQQLQSFLSIQQQKTFHADDEPELSVYLLDGSFISVTVGADGDVIGAALSQLKLAHFARHFALYIMRLNGDAWHVYRKLYRFESANVSIKRLLDVDHEMRLTLVRDYWNANIDEQLIQTQSGLNLLYAECLSAWRQQWLICRDLPTEKHLASLVGSKRDFVNLCRAQHYYSCLQFGPMFCDYPTNRTPCLINIGDYKLYLRLLLDNDVIKQVIIPMRQIRGWRVIKSNGVATAISIETSISRSSQVWVELVTRDAMVMSSMLYTMINVNSAIDHASSRDWIDFTREDRESDQSY